MSLQDRGWRPGGFGEGAASGNDRFRAFFARVFGDAENPLQWAVPVARIAGIRVRIHVLFLVYVVAQLLVAGISADAVGFWYVAIAMPILFAIVLLHEFGHCVACRAVGGEADDILMWPLGGLASCDPPDTPRAHAITVLGGPAVNVAIAPFTFAALYASGHGDAAFFNPLEIGYVLGGLGSYAMVALWWAHAINLFILLFNILLPMYPLDGGRLLQTALWRKMGYRAASDLAATVGFVAAAVLGVVGLVADRTSLLGIAIFAAFVCWHERRRLRAADEVGGYVVGGEFRPLPDDEPEDRGPSRREIREREREEARQVELDRILAKIAAHGMGSLDRGERKALEHETKRRRGE